MNLKQLQKIAFNNCDVGLMGFKYGLDLPECIEPSKPCFYEMRILLMYHEKDEIRNFFKAKYAIRVNTDNDGRGFWINTKNQRLIFGY